MPEALARACSTLGCSNVQPCHDHESKRIAPKHHTLYNRKAWKLFRRRILAERVWCEACLRAGKRPSVMGCSETTAGPTSDVHHIIDLVAGGARLDPANVEALSHACHSRVTRHRQNTP